MTIVCALRAGLADDIRRRNDTPTNRFNHGAREFICRLAHTRTRLRLLWVEGHPD